MSVNWAGTLRSAGLLGGVSGSREARVEVGQARAGLLQLSVEALERLGIDQPFRLEALQLALLCVQTIQGSNGRIDLAQELGQLLLLRLQWWDGLRRRDGQDLHLRRHLAQRRSSGPELCSRLTDSSGEVCRRLRRLLLTAIQQLQLFYGLSRRPGHVAHALSDIGLLEAQRLQLVVDRHRGLGNLGHGGGRLALPLRHVGQGARDFRLSAASSALVRVPACTRRSRSVAAVSTLSDSTRMPSWAMFVILVSAPPSLPAPRPP